MKSKRKWTFPGFPKTVGNPIEMPGIAELLRIPMLHQASPEQVYKYGSEFLKHLMDQVQLTNKYKYVCVDSYIQYLDPRACSINIRTTGEFLHEWHTDGIPYLWDKPSTFHILCSECSARTVFNEFPVEVEIDEETSAFGAISEINRNADVWGIHPKKMPVNQFVTFTNHLHNSCIPNGREFRFFIRVTESDIMVPQPSSDTGLINYSYTSFLSSNRTVTKIPSVTQLDDHIKVEYLPYRK